jgi:hypothetical protein
MEKMNPVKPLFPNLAENLWWSWNLAMNHLQSHIVTSKNEGEIQMNKKDASGKLDEILQKEN